MNGGQAGGVHPTGMLSCYTKILVQSINRLFVSLAICAFVEKKFKSMQLIGHILKFSV